MKKLFLVFFLATMCGCTYHFQSREPVTAASYKAPSYPDPDSVGRLRRLVLMPVEIKSYEGRHDSPKDQTDTALRYESACYGYLTDKKGYDVVRTRDDNGIWNSGMLSTSGYGGIEALNARWREARTGEEKASIIREISRAFGADGVITIQIRELKPWGFAEALLNIAFMDIPLFYRVISPNIKVCIYQGVSGRLVWRQAQAGFMQVEGKDTPRRRWSASGNLVPLLEDLQNAVPPQLLKREDFHFNLLH
jgi:hypothetical protein